MSALEFIDSITGKLAWPLTALTLGLIFRRSLVQLVERIRTLRWGETEAELAEMNETMEDLQSAVKEASGPLPEDNAESEQERRRRLERVIMTAFNNGASMGRLGHDHGHDISGIEVAWNDNGEPVVIPYVEQVKFHRGQIIRTGRQYQLFGDPPQLPSSIRNWKENMKPPNDQ